MKIFDTSYEHRDTVRRARHGMPWTEGELQKLRGLFHSGLTLEGMCIALERPAAGVISKLASMDLIDFDSKQCKYLYDPCTRPVSSVPVSPKPALKKEPAMTAKNIETQTLIRGVDASTLSDAQIFSRIAELEGDIAKLSAIKVSSAKLAKAIQQLRDDVQALASYVDSRP